MPTSRSAPSLPFAYPVVVKALSAEIAHKTEAGGVVLNVADGAALLAAIKQIRANVAQRRPNTRVLRVLVQPMVAGIGEALIGYRVDPAAGPLVMVAAGGILTEIYRDRSLRLAPVDLAIAQEMIAEVRAFKALAGFRGRPKGDLDALAQAIVAMSQLAERSLDRRGRDQSADRPQRRRGRGRCAGEARVSARHDSGLHTAKNNEEPPMSHAEALHTRHPAAGATDNVVSFVSQAAA